MHEAMTPAQITATLRAALDGEDLHPLLDLLDPGVSWAPVPDSAPTTPGRAAILTWYAALHAAGTSTDVDESFTYPDAVVVALAGTATTDPQLYQVFRIVSGRITEIRGHADRHQALDAAYHAG